MVAPAGLEGPSTGPIGVPPTIQSEEISLGSSFLYDGTNSLWWRFTAPADGLYGFDAALSTVEGSTTATEPYAIVQASILPVWSDPVPGTSAQWAGFQLTSGQTIDISITAVSSLDDLTNSTLRPVNVILRSAGPNSITTNADEFTLETAELVGVNSTGGTSLSLPLDTQIGDIAIFGAKSEELGISTSMSATWALGGSMTGSASKFDGGNSTVFDIILVSSIDDLSINIDYVGGSNTAASVWVVRWGQVSTILTHSGAVDRDQFTGIAAGTLGTNVDFEPGIPPTGYASTGYGNGDIWPSFTGAGIFIDIKEDMFVPGGGYSSTTYPWTPDRWLNLGGGSTGIQAFIFEGSPWFRRDWPETPFSTQTFGVAPVSPFLTYFYDATIDDEQIFVIRQYPRDDMFGFSGSPRVYPPSKGKRPEGSKPRFIGGFD